MTFISFAQNCEDVMLWRALGHIRDGFYIDAGAWSPDDDSVTRAFYERGWRGINIEPNPMWFEKFSEKRAEDINLSLALSDKEGIIDLHIAVDLTGLSTVRKDYAKQNEKDGHLLQTVSCQTITLNKLWDEHVGQKQVHFLKIDVEGSETEVLLGNDWMKNRPWVVLIESTYPNTQISNHHLWEHLLLDSDYVYTYSDGLNRFYVAKEHSDLSDSFKYPPNFFDQFKIAPYARAEEYLAILSQTQRELSQQHQSLTVQHQSLEARHQMLEARHRMLEAQHFAAVRILVELRKTRIYKFIQYLNQWKWMERDILDLEYFHNETKK